VSIITYCWAFEGRIWSSCSFEKFEFLALNDDVVEKVISGASLTLEMNIGKDIWECLTQTYSIES